MTDVRVAEQGRRVSRLPLVLDLARHGDRRALVTADTALTYADLADHVDASAAAQAGTRRLVVLRPEPTIDGVVEYLGAFAAGHAVLLVPPGTVGDAVAEPYRDVVEPHPDLALCLSTSGSTGSPKLVRLSHENVQSNAEAIAASLGLGADDCGITSLPLHYTYGLSVLHSHLAVGAAVVLTDLSVVDECFWRLVDDHGVTTVAGVPFTFELLDRSGFADRTVPSLRRVTQAGGRLDPDSVRRYAELGASRGWDLVVMYGQTEATARMTVLPPSLAWAHPDSVGRPVPGGSVRLAPVEDAAPDVGELVYSGPNVMMGYAHCAADLARGREIAELRTGDLARIDDTGLVRIVGRLARFVKPFGVRVDLSAVEESLRAQGLAVTVVGDDDGVALAVVDARDVDRARSACLAATGLPPGAVQVAVVAEVPRLPSGKVDAVAIVAAARSGAAPTSASGVRQVFADVLGRDDVTPADSFVSLGGDSLSYVEVSIRLEQVIGEVPDGWHLLPVADLERRERSGTARLSRRTVQMDTTVVLRAIAITLVVGHHTQAIGFQGGAHTMLVLAGYNLARFRLSGTEGADRQRLMWRSIAAIAVPSVAWMLLQSVYWDHGWKNFLLLHNYLGERPMGPAWRYWYIEVVVQTLVLVALAMSVRRVREFEARHRYGVAVGVLGAALVARYAVGVSDAYVAIFTTHTVVWLFALGWLVERSRTTGRRLVVSAIAVATIPGFFGEWSRELVVVLGVLALTWLSTVRVPRALARPVGLLAGASLAIYLTHWQVYHPLRPEVPAWIVAPLCLVVGVGVWLAALRLQREWRRHRTT